jgi:hypothetical protein
MDEAEAALRAAIRLLKAEFNRLDPARHEPANATAPEEVRVIAELLADSTDSLAGVRRA